MYEAIGACSIQSGADMDTLRHLIKRDIKDELDAGIVPLCLDTVRWKTENTYLTFIDEWAITYLRKYLESRGSLRDEDLLFPVSEQAVDQFYRRQGEAFLQTKFKTGQRNPLLFPRSWKRTF